MNKLNIAGMQERVRSGNQALPGRNPPVRNALALLSLAAVGVLLAGCSSSNNPGSHTFNHAAPQYAAEGEPSYADRLEAGEDLNLPMYIQGYTFTPDERTLEGEEGNFQLRLGSTVTIETGTRTISWEDVSAALGDFSRSVTVDTEGNDVLDTEMILASRYLEFVHFGYWQENRIDLAGEFVATGGGFRHGLETDPDNVPTVGSASFTGTTLGAGTHATEGEYTFEGSLAINADFATGGITGSIETFFNRIGLGGTITGNQISGDATVTESTSSGVSFEPGSSGVLRGTFFGPNAEEVGGVWSLQDENNLAVGGFGGRQP